MKLANNHTLSWGLFYRLVWVLGGLLLLVLLGRETAVSVQAHPQQQDGVAQLMASAEEIGTVRVLVQLDLPFRPEGDLGSMQAVRTQQLGIDGLQDSVVNQLADTNTAVIATYKYIPYLALELDAAALEMLASLPQVVSIEEDVPVPSTLGSSLPVIGAAQAWSAGYTGSGQTVAILDTGVATGHAAFTTGGSRIVAEGCYSTTSATHASTTICPGGVPQSTAVGSGMDCTAAVGPANSKAQSDCSHGTHVASIAAGNDGVAPDANIIAIQVFSLFNSTYWCGGFSNCMLTFASDQIAGLERVYELRHAYNIASVNMSLGGGQYFSACDSDGRKAMIDNLRAAGIATVIASGNSGYRDSIGAPACISSAISVGATDDADNVASFSNIAPFIDLVAPGVNIYAAVPTGLGTKSGTSMAAPHVAGAWALLKQATPGASVDEALAAFQAGAVLVDDNRSSGTATNLARIHVNDAINAYVAGLTVNVTAAEQYLLPGDGVTLNFEISNDTGTSAGQVGLALPLPQALLLDVASLSGDAVVASNSITWNTGQTLDPGQSLVRSATFTVPNDVPSGEVALVATAVSPQMDEARHGTAVLTINEVVSCGFSDGFESGVLGTAWETAVTAEGRVRVLPNLPHSGSYSAVLDDSIAGGAYSEAALILTADLTGDFAELFLDFSWYDLGDEYHHAYDGLFVRQQPGEAWLKVYDFAGSNHDSYQDGRLDLVTVASDNGLALTDRFQIKFGFYDNFPFDPANIGSGDGYAIDDVSLTCVPKGLAATQAVDNSNPKPGDAVNFQIVVTNNSAMTATNAVINFYLADGLQLSGAMVMDVGTAVSSSLNSTLPLIASGLTIGAGEQVVITVPTVVAEDLPPGTMLENTLAISSDEFGSTPATTYCIFVVSSSYQVFIPIVIR